MKVIALATLIVGPREKPITVPPGKPADLSKEEGERLIRLGHARLPTKADFAAPDDGKKAGGSGGGGSGGGLGAGGPGATGAGGAGQGGGQ